ncbi:hypothetical protein [Lacticaseibacillus jixiensis]|uniref:hypothetical protein n=1 Tax=Lacticaseibacillus jixiensis TaxID=3231926 RepID=UPI0036F433BB
MDLGSVADWLNMVATSALAVVAVYFSHRQFKQQRDSELRVVLKSVESDEDGQRYSGYELVAINNSEGNSVILQNTTSPLVTEVRDDIFGNKKWSTSEVVKDARADYFQMDRAVAPQSTEVLWRFGSMLRGRIPKNSHSGSTDEMDWYFYDAVSQRHYQVVLHDNPAAKNLVADLHTQKDPFEKEQWGQELDWEAHLAKDTIEVLVVNRSHRLCKVRTEPSDGQGDGMPLPYNKRTIMWKIPKSAADNKPLYCYDSARSRHYQVVIRMTKRRNGNTYPEARSRSQLVPFEEAAD